MASLGVETLGTPAEVILLRDAELGIKQARETVSEEVGEASMSAADLLAAMKAERGLPAPEDVARNIEKFRPLSPNIGLSQAEWLEIKKKLSVAFTTRQFAQYIIYKIQENATVEAQNRKASKILQKSTWTPGETPFEGFRLDNMERRRTVTKSPMSRKEILAERILGDCWGLHVRAGVNDTGELEVLIRPQHLSLLVHKGKSFHSRHISILAD